MPTGPTLMKGVKRTNAVIICPNQRAGFAQHNLYTIDVDRGNRNYYSCRGFEHLARNCRNRENKIRKGKRLEYRERRMLEGGNKQ